MIKERIAVFLSFILIFNLFGVHNLCMYAQPVSEAVQAMELVQDAMSDSDFLSAGASYYIYNQLSDKERAWWDEYDSIMKDYLECTTDISGVETKGISVDSIEDVLKLKNILMGFWYSNPQYFFLTPDFEWEQSDKTGDFYVYGKVYYGFARKNNRANAKVLLRNKIDEILSEVRFKVSDTDGDEAASFSAIHDELCKKLTYSPFAAGSIIADSRYLSSPACILSKDAAADSLGYSRTLSLICNIYGIDAVSVASYLNIKRTLSTNMTDVSELHAFNKVRINGFWHNFDLCWDDEWKESLIDPVKEELLKNTVSDWTDDYVKDNILNKENIITDYYGKKDYDFNHIAFSVSTDYICPYDVSQVNPAYSVFGDYLPECFRDDISHSKPEKTPSPSINSFYGINSENVKECYVFLNDDDDGRGAVIYYTTDGTDPDINKSRAYIFDGSEFIAKGKGIIKAVAVNVKEGKAVSDVVTQRVQYVVNYYLDGGINHPDNIADFDIDDSEVFELNNPQKDYYIFKGWYATSSLDGVSVNSIDKSRHEDISLYAKWIPESYGVSLNTAGGYLPDGSRDHFRVVYTETYGELPDPVRKGYTFTGWYVSDNRILPDSAVKITSDHELTAGWTPNRYVISFNPALGKTPVDTLTVQYDSPYGMNPLSSDKVYELPQPVRDGYTFTGWTLSGAVITKDTIVKTDDDHSLTATWDGNYFDLIYNCGEGGTTKEPSKKVKNDYPYGELENAVKTGYSFIEWVSENRTHVDKNTITSTVSDINIFAVYRPNRYKVTFEPGTEGSCAIREKIVEYDAKYCYIPDGPANEYDYLPVCIRRGYDFVGWFTSESKGDKGDKEDREEIKNNTIVKIPGDHVLYADYTPKKYSVSLKGNEGYIIQNGKKLTDTVITVTYDTEYNLPIAIRNPDDGPYRTGYKFMGWFTEEEGGREIRPADIVKITDDITLYAHWQATDYMVFFDANGGECEVSQNGAICEYEYGYLPVPERTGYRFDGWYTARNLGEKILTQTIYNTEGNTTLYAHWVPNAYYVKYNGNGATAGSMEDSRFIYDNTGYLKNNLFTKEGFAFGGWNLEADGSGTFFEDAAAINNIATEADTVIEMYAQWKNVDYKLTLNANYGNFDGENIQVVYAKYGEIYGNLPVPVRNGYLFTGYYTDPEAGIRVNTQTVFRLLEDQTLYAHWEHVGNQGEKIETEKPSVTPVPPADEKEVSKNSVPPRLISAPGKYTAIKGDTVSVNLAGIDSKQIRVRGKGSYSNGVLRLLRKGSVKLYYLNGKKKVNLVTIKVVEPSVKKTLKLKQGKVKPLKIGKINSDAGFVTYASNKPGVADVDEAGNIRAVAPGVAIITVSIGNHVYKTSVSVK